jgi:hypothetical protein
MTCSSLPIGAVTFRNTVTTADATTGLTVKAGVSGKVIYVTDITISTDTKTNIEIQDSASAVICQHMYFPATSIWSKTWCTPLEFAVNNGVKVVAADAGNVSVTITGFIK